MTRNPSRQFELLVVLVLTALPASLLSFPDLPRPAGITVTLMDSPAGMGSREPNLTVAADGKAYLSWLEAAQPSGSLLRFAVRGKGGAWSAPSTVTQRDNWYMSSSVQALPEGTLVAHWISRSGHAEDVNIAMSRDAGRTWSKPVVPHRDGTKTEHGFVSILPAASGATVFWLDGRKTAGAEHKPVAGASLSDTGMALMYTTLGVDGALGTETVLDGLVCECCHTSAALTPGGMAVVYRDRSEKEIRDISIVRFEKGKWTQPKTVAPDNWEINGCPVNGPSISAAGKNVGVAWFTVEGQKPRVYAAKSGDSGATFGPKVLIDDGNPAGRADVVAFAAGSFLVSWVERTANKAEVRARLVKADGSRGESVVVGETKSNGFPRMEAAGGEVIIAWTDAATPSRVRTAILTVAGVK